MYHNTYSVPSRLIGSRLLVKLRSETLDMYLAGTLVLTVPRLKGRNQHRIDYRHVIWSLVRKPGAFSNYRYRDEFLSDDGVQACLRRPECPPAGRGEGDYLRILHMAASVSEADVKPPSNCCWRQESDLTSSL